MSFVSVLVSLIRYSDAEHYFLTKEYLQHNLFNIKEMVNFILGLSYYPLLCIRYPITLVDKKRVKIHTFIDYNLYKPLLSIVALLFNTDFQRYRVYHHREIVLGGGVSLSRLVDFSYYYYNGRFLDNSSYGSMNELMEDKNTCILLEEALKRIILNNENIILISV